MNRRTGAVGGATGTKMSLLSSVSLWNGLYYATEYYLWMYAGQVVLTLRFEEAGAFY